MPFNVSNRVEKASPSSWLDLLIRSPRMTYDRSFELSAYIHSRLPCLTCTRGFTRKPLYCYNARVNMESLAHVIEALWGCTRLGRYEDEPGKAVNAGIWHESTPSHTHEHSWGLSATVSRNRACSLYTLNRFHNTYAIHLPNIIPRTIAHGPRAFQWFDLQLLIGQRQINLHVPRLHQG